MLAIREKRPLRKSEEARFHRSIRANYCPKVKLLLDGVNADLLAVAAHALETNLAVDKCKQRVVGASAYVLARMNVGTALLNKDVTSQNVLTVSTLYAKSLGLGVTSVVGRALSFFMGEELNIDIKHVLHLSEVNVVRILPG